MIQAYNFVFYFFYGVAGIQLFFMLIVFGRTLFLPKKKGIETNELPGVSVVIAAKNELLKLKKFLPLILEQNYPNFEVIVVNDGSTDETEYLLKDLKQKYPHLNYLNVQSNANFFHGKKFPLSMGIKSTHNEIVLLTDADCKPASQDWIMEMQMTYDSNTEIVLGYGAYATKKGILNKLIRYDTIRKAITYMSMAVWGMPYMGVGRNLSYTKSLFYAQKGFMSHYKIASGDDDLFINKAANRKNTKIALGENSKTISLPESSFSNWIRQKRRHLTTGFKYKKLHLIVLGLWESTTILFYLLFVFLLIIKLHIYIVIGIFAARLVAQLVITKKFMLINNERKLLLISPLLEIFLVILEPIVTILNLLYKQRKWK